MSYQNEQDCFLGSSSENMAFDASCLTERVTAYLNPGNRGLAGQLLLTGMDSFQESLPELKSDAYSTNGSLNLQCLESSPTLPVLDIYDATDSEFLTYFPSFKISKFQTQGLDLEFPADFGMPPSCGNLSKPSLELDLGSDLDAIVNQPLESAAKSVYMSEVRATSQPIRKRKREPKASLPGTGVWSLCGKREAAGFNQKPPKRLRASFENEGMPVSSKKQKRAPNGTVCNRCKLNKARCDGETPCGGCITTPLWRHICWRAKLDQTCFSKDIYSSRVNVLVRNVNEWVPERLVSLEIGFEFNAVLRVSVNRFIPKRKELLDHISFRITSDEPLDRHQTEPWGLLEDEVTPLMLDQFLDQIVPEMLESTALRHRSPFLANVLRISHIRSQQPTRKDSNMFRRLLRLWAAQSSFFERPWRIRGLEGAGLVNARYHENLSAFDLPRLLYWQLDSVMDDYMKSLEKCIMDDLEASLFPSGADHRSPLGVSTVFIAAFIYLALLERDTWQLKTWAKKSEAWKKDPLVSENPVRTNGPPKSTLHTDDQQTMKWPLAKNPVELMNKNANQAQAIANHVRASNSGHQLTAKFLHGINDNNVRALGNLLGLTHATIGTQLRFRGPEPYQENDSASLDYTYTSKLLITPDGRV